MRCDKDGLTKCCGNLEQLVFPGRVEEACPLEETFALRFGLMSKCSPGEEEEREHSNVREQLVQERNMQGLGMSLGSSK